MYHRCNTQSRAESLIFSINAFFAERNLSPGRAKNLALQNGKAVPFRSIVFRTRGYAAITRPRTERPPSRPHKNISPHHSRILSTTSRPHDAREVWGK